ncbi:MAG: low-specificity L-threonine aldolase [Dinoroseobacter sp.]|nr:low-specificity L-threonine aldolase [Dinoroseobacter sp.]
MNLRCDLRSDTVTRPCAGMRAAMASAEVGDDVYGEDPTVTRLEDRLAEMLGKEAGLFLPSGSMSNLCALMSLGQRGDAVITGKPYHVNAWEAGSASVLGAMMLVVLEPGADAGLAGADVAAAIFEDDPHFARSRILSIENTVSGQAVSLTRMDEAIAPARQAGLAVHLDGARLFNAALGLGVDASELAARADTVSVCLSKGLGAPVGTCLVGPREVLYQARRARKLLGGGMRQAGVLAAAALWALDHVLPELHADHARAEALAEGLGKLGLGQVRQATNMVHLHPDPSLGDVHALLAAQGVLIGAPHPESRMVLHRDVDDTALEAALSCFDQFSSV